MPAGVKHRAFSQSSAERALSLGHVAFIPDGNRRWARRHGLPDREGHRRGFLVVAPALIARAFDEGAHVVTLWMFSSDNWRRSREEIDALMAIYDEAIHGFDAYARERGIRIEHIGRRDRLPPELCITLDSALSHPVADDARILALVIDDGGHNGLPFTDRLPPIDLIVRTSGERRLSGFPSVHALFAELAFVEECFPEFNSDAFGSVVADYRARLRRDGA